MGHETVVFIHKRKCPMVFFLLLNVRPYPCHMRFTNRKSTVSRLPGKMSGRQLLLIELVRTGTFNLFNYVGYCLFGVEQK